eukprot:gene10928-22814_t
MFSLQNSYDLRIFSPYYTNVNYDTIDPRWNKIKIFQDILHPNSEWGCFIVKNSSWSQTFFTTWWTSYDRSSAMDQHVFTSIYNAQYPNILEHIVILPPDVINSKFPVWEYQQSNQSVLHLAGKGIDENNHISDYNQNALTLLSLYQSQQYHQSTRNSINSLLVNIRRSDMQRNVTDVTTVTPFTLDDINKFRSQLRDLMQTGYASTSSLDSTSIINDIRENDNSFTSCN